MKRHLSITLTFLLFASANAQQVLNLLTGEVRDGYDAANPIYTEEKLDDGYLITWDFSEAVVSPDRDFHECVMWDVPGFMPESIPGKPAFPYQNDWLEIFDSTPTMKIVECKYRDYSYQLAPAIPCQPISENPYSEVPRLPITPYEGFLPVSPVVDLGISEMFEHLYVCYRIIPIQYNYEQQIIRAYTKIVYKVTLSDKITNIRELEFKPEQPFPFSLDGRPRGNSIPWIICDGKKLLLR